MHTYLKILEVFYSFFVSEYSENSLKIYLIFSSSKFRGIPLNNTPNFYYNSA